jgi:uncharacterized protein
VVRAEAIRVEVAYSPALGAVRRYDVRLPVGATVADAIAASKVMTEYPEIDFTAGFGISVFGVRSSQVSAVLEGDRVEILRPLNLDPKDARRSRVRQPKRDTQS